MCSITAGLMGASALFGYASQRQQASAQAKALNAQAEADEQNARIEARKQEQIADNYAKESRDLRSRQRLAQGAQRAQAGAAGIDFSGSQQDLLSSGLTAYEEDQRTLLSNQRNDNFNSRVAETNFLNAAGQKRAQASNVVSSAKSQWLPTLLSTAGSIVGVTGGSSGGDKESGGAETVPGTWTPGPKMTTQGKTRNDTGSTYRNPSINPWSKKTKNW